MSPVVSTLECPRKLRSHSDGTSVKSSLHLDAHPRMETGTQSSVGGVHRTPRLRAVPSTRREAHFHRENAPSPETKPLDVAIVQLSTPHLQFFASSLPQPPLSGVTTEEKEQNATQCTSTTSTFCNVRSESLLSLDKADTTEAQQEISGDVQRPPESQSPPPFNRPFTSPPSSISSSLSPHAFARLTMMMLDSDIVPCMDTDVPDDELLDYMYSWSGYGEEKSENDLAV